VGEKILHGQWASPTVGRIGGVDQVIMGQGDGWIRGYEAGTGKKLWEFDTNPKNTVWPKTRNEVISTAIVADGLVFIANGQDPEHGEGAGHLYAIDATKRGDITETGRVWHYDRIRRSISTGAVKDGLLYYSDFSGFLHCVDAKTGKPHWAYDMLAAVWSSPVVIGNRVYLGDEDGDITVFEHGSKVNVVAELNMGNSVYSSVVPANGSLYVANRNTLFALAEGAQRPK
jgi:outer membrane protein assembly factor BamB